MKQNWPGTRLRYIKASVKNIFASLKPIAPLYTNTMVEITKLEPGMCVKTRGNQIVEVFSVRAFNNTVSVGTSRKYPLLISAGEIQSIVSEE